MAGKLLLLPNLLDETLPAAPFLPAETAQAVASIQGLICESEKAGRRYVRRFLTHDQMAALPLQTLNEHSLPEHLEELLVPLKNGEIWGLVTDAGLPCIADPGSDLVWKARCAGIAVQTIVGPCSILMALQLSGFSGQKFSFHGYLPREADLLEKQVAELEKRSLAERATQIWIEAPYRSSKMLDFLKIKLHPSTRLCVAVQLTTPSERVVSMPVEQWRKTSFPIEKEPAVFLLQRLG